MVPWQWWMILAVATCPLILIPHHIASVYSNGFIFMLLVAGWSGYNLQAVSTDDLIRFIGTSDTVSSSRLIRVQGRVKDVVPTPSNQRHTCLLHVDTRVDPTHGLVPCIGKLQIFLHGTRSFVVGERIEIQGWARPPSNSPSFPDWVDIARRTARRGRVFVPDDNLVTLLPPTCWQDHAQLARAQLQHTVTERVVSGITNQKSSALIALMITGVRKPSWKEVAAPFRRIGVAHLLAISGLHLALLVGGCLIMFQLCIGHSAWRGRFGIVVILFYLLIVQWRPPILRSAGMLGLYSLGVSFRRRFSAYGLLSIAFLLLIACDPGQMFMPGFQLSFLVVTSLIYGTRRVAYRWIKPEDVQQRRVIFLLSKYCASACIVSFIAWLVSTPIVMHHFNICSPLGSVTSVLLLPPTAVLLFLGYLRLLTGWSSETLDDALRQLLEVSSGFIITLVEYVDRIPMSSFETESPPVWLTLTMIIAVIAWIQFGLRNSLWYFRQLYVRRRSSNRIKVSNHHD